MNQIEERKMSETVVICPTEPRRPGDISGCGSSDVSPADEEGFHDCQNCGMFFKAEAFQATDGKLHPDNSQADVRVSPSAVVGAKLTTETIGLYLTRSGKEGARVTRTLHANGRVSHSWIGEWGAGSGSLEGIKKSVLFTHTQKRGYKSVIALA